MNFRDRAVNIVAGIVREGIEKGLEQLENPTPAATNYIEVQAAPKEKPIPPPPQTGARPNPNLPAFSLPAPIDVPPVSEPKSSLPPPQTNGPRPRGRPRKDRPPLFPLRNQGQLPEPEEPESEK
jgi:hypothetical protein